MHLDLREYFVKSACRKSLFATCMFCRGGSKNIQQLFTISLPFVHNSLGKRGYDRNVNSTTLQISPSLFFHAEPAASPAAGFVCFGGRGRSLIDPYPRSRVFRRGGVYPRPCPSAFGGNHTEIATALRAAIKAAPTPPLPVFSVWPPVPFASLARRGCFRYNGATLPPGGHSLGQALF